MRGSNNRRPIVILNCNYIKYEIYRNVRSIKTFDLSNCLTMMLITNTFVLEFLNSYRFPNLLLKWELITVLYNYVTMKGIMGLWASDLCNCGSSWGDLLYILYITQTSKETMDVTTEMTSLTEDLSTSMLENPVPNIVVTDSEETNLLSPPQRHRGSSVPMIVDAARKLTMSDGKYINGDYSWFRQNSKKQSQQPQREGIQSFCKAK